MEERNEQNWLRKEVGTKKDMKEKTDCQFW